jgi:aldehyde:ferredoxin oxidoreductase
MWHQEGKGAHVVGAQHGWAGKIVFIDLSRGTTKVEPTEKYCSFLGGRGINQWLLFNLLERNVPPLDPRNPLILGAGPMVGTLVPSASRLAVDHKNVITGGVGSGNCGGRFAAEMKYAGYDHIVITGKAPTPQYVCINDDGVRFRDASDIWGRDTRQTDDIIKSRENDRGLSILTIGPAGEHLVKFACVIGDKGRAAAYGGSGAIMGSKNLKAVAVRGKSVPITIARPVEFMNRLREFTREVFEKSSAVKIHRKGGTLGAYLLPGEKRPHGVRNLREEFWSNDSIEQVTRDKFDEFLVRRHSCFNCPVYCSALYRVKDTLCEGIQANSWRAFGSNVDVTCAEDILYAHALCNLYGLDCDQTSAVVAWAIDCFESGLLDTTDTDGMELRFGDGNAVATLITKIAFRQGLGNILADGVYEASEAVGRGSATLTALVKRNSVMEAGMRSHKGWALGIVTSTKGTGHLRGASGLEFQRIPTQLSKDILQIGDISDPTSYQNKAALVVWQERYKGVVDMMGICALTSMWMDITLFTPDDIAAFLSDITGMEYSGMELLEAGERLQNLEKAFNILHAGFQRSDDMPPEKFEEVPVSEGIFAGERLDPAKWNRMLDEYYEHHGWDTITGWPSKKCLFDLGLNGVVEKLVKNGVLLD